MKEQDGMTLVKENEQEMTLAKVKEQYGKIAPQVLMPLGKYQLAGTHKFIISCLRVRRVVDRDQIRR